MLLGVLWSLQVVVPGLAGHLRSLLRACALLKGFCVVLPSGAPGCSLLDVLCVCRMPATRCRVFGSLYRWASSLTAVCPASRLPSRPSGLPGLPAGAARRRWVSALQPARVTRWGGMISTPDAVLQAVIKRSLLESGCPLAVVTGLIENSHERKWPPGLSTLETRQMNRRYYENYVTKRVPGKQAVVAMALENQHMGDDMIVEPGLVMIFAHGVEDV